jgi:mono/diheme cytochrome c family protein
VVGFDLLSAVALGSGLLALVGPAVARALAPRSAGSQGQAGSAALAGWVPRAAIAGGASGLLAVALLLAAVPPGSRGRLSPQVGYLAVWAAVQLAAGLAARRHGLRAGLAALVCLAGAAAFFSADVLTIHLVTTRPYDLGFPAPTLAPRPWSRIVLLFAYEVLASVSTWSFVSLALSGGGPGRGGAGEDRWRRAVLLGLLFLAPEQVVAFLLGLAVLRHQAVTWAVLMAGDVARLWFVATGMTVGLVVVALVTAWRLHRGAATPGARRVRAGLALGGLALAAGLTYGGSVMVWRFTLHMGLIAAGFALLALVAAALPRGVHCLRLGTALVALLALGLTAASWNLALRRYLYKNHVLARIEAPAASLPADPVVRGRLVAQRAGCFACHGEDGMAVRPNPGDPTALVPSWASARFARTFGPPHSQERLMLLLWEGQYAYRIRYYPQGGDWSVAYDTADNVFNVPAWNGIITRPELRDLVAYLRYLADPEAAAAPVESARRGRSLAGGAG